MAEEVVHTGWQYKLRAGSPMPIIGSDGAFVMHTFMAEKTRVDAYSYTKNLPKSEDFVGQGGNYVSASFSRLSDRSGDVFQGRITYVPEIVEEEDINTGGQY